MFEGVFPPIPTPFADGEVAHHRLSENIAQWNQTGLAGYVVLGSNGENVYLSEAEKRVVMVTAREAIPDDKLFIVGTGRESTKLTIGSTQTAADLGADGALVVTPSYYKEQMTPEALYRHYISVADASPIPILVYNVPKFTGLNIAPTLVARLAEHPRIVGIKDSAGNIGQLIETIRLAAPDFEVLVGNAPTYYSALGVGAVGAILALANVAPRECVAIQELFEQSRFDEARVLHFMLMPVGRAVTSQFGIGGLKAALDLLGYYGGNPRSPLLYPSPEEVEEIRGLLRQAELLT
jgi:4-hydroxy-2-oxoglutarate aldolase